MSENTQAIKTRKIIRKKVVNGENTNIPPPQEPVQPPQEPVPQQPLNEEQTQPPPENTMVESIKTFFTPKTAAKKETATATKKEPSPRTSPRKRATKNVIDENKMDIQTIRERIQSRLASFPTSPPSNANPSNDYNALMAMKNVFTQLPTPMPEPVYDATKYTIHGEEYLYLSDDYLTRDFDTILNKYQLHEKLQIRLCIFKINSECKEPFLQFFIEKNEQERIAGFPYFEVTAGDMNNQPEPDKFFEERIFLEYDKILQTPPENIATVNEIIPKAYRGIIEDEDNILYVVFDSTYMDIVPNDKQVWCILDEMINEQHIGEYIIDKNLFYMIHKNDHLSYIKTKAGTNVRMPCCLYLCQRTEDGADFENVYYQEGEDRNIESIMYPKIDHPVLGDFYYFTTDPITEANVANIKRYAAFIDNSLYLLNVTTPIEDINFDKDAEIDEDIDEERTHKDYTSIYFFDKTKQLWCIKNTIRFTEL
jgi:hypothetical protein